MNTFYLTVKKCSFDCINIEIFQRLFWWNKSKESSGTTQVDVKNENLFEPCHPSEIPGISLKNVKKTYQENIFDKYVSANQFYLIIFI